MLILNEQELQKIGGLWIGTAEYLLASEGISRRRLQQINAITGQSSSWRKGCAEALEAILKSALLPLQDPRRYFSSQANGQQPKHDNHESSLSYNDVAAALNDSFPDTCSSSDESTLQVESDAIVSASCFSDTLHDLHA